MTLRPLFLVLILCALAACGGTNVHSHSDAGVEPLPDVEADGGGSFETDAGTECLPRAGVGTPLITGLRGARRLAVDAMHLYVTVTGTLTQAEGRLLRVPLAGGASEELATGLRNPDAVAAANGAAFVVDDEGLWRVDLQSRARTRVDATPANGLFGDTELLVDGDALILSTGFRWLVRVKQDGSGRIVLHEGEPGASVRGAALRGAELFFLVAGGGGPGLYRVPADGSGLATRVRGQPDDGRTLYVDGERLVWTEGSSGAGRIVSAGFDGKAVQTLAENLARPARLARVDDAVYFKDRPPTASDGFFRAVSRCGLVPVGPVGMGPGDVLVHGGVVFFTSEDGTGQGYVSRVP